MADDIVLGGFVGTCTFSAGPATATTNQLSGVFNFTNVRLEKGFGTSEFSADVESDGIVYMTGFTATSLAAAVTLAGYGSGVTIANATTSAMQADFQSWSLQFNIDTDVYQTFSSMWKNSKIIGGNVTGTVTGKMNSQRVVPIA